jgi:integrase
MTAAGSWQDALLAAAPMAPRELPRARCALSRLAAFAAGRGLPPSPECLLDYDVIEAYCVAGLPGRAPSTRGTYRSVLYALAAGVHGQPGCRGTPFAGARAPAPYSYGERAGLAAIARAQRSPASRASALAMIVFGIGAGLRPGELTGLRGCEVTQAAGQVMAGVTGGPAPRTVPVTSRYAGRAVELASGAGGGFIFRPGPADRGYKNFVNVFAARLARDRAGPVLSAGRCRASFICDHLAAGTTLHELLAIAGITEPESLARCAAHVPGMSSSKAALRARWHAENPR